MIRRNVDPESKHENCTRTYRAKRHDVCFVATWCHGKNIHTALVPRPSRDDRKYSS